MMIQFDTCVTYVDSTLQSLVFFSGYFLGFKVCYTLSFGVDFLA